MLKSMVKYLSKTTTQSIKGGNKVKKFSLVMALALALMMTVGVSVAFAAPGDYPPDSTSGQFTAPLTSTQGNQDAAATWGLDNGIVNANLTGSGIDTNDGSTLDQVIKNVQGQRTHGEYANDTNSCASCHKTHTASGRQLLVKNGIYNTCAACHDGTLGFYNVFQVSNAGTFGGNPDKAVGNASLHMATGVMKVSAAPGGNRTSTDAGTWGKDFTCASCHAPHGSYSDRLLHYNPNGIGKTDPAQGGKLMAGQEVTLDTGKYYAVKPGTTTKVTGPFLYGYTHATPKVYWSMIWYDANGNGTKDIVINAATGKPGIGTEYFAPSDPTKSFNDIFEVNYRGGFFTDEAGYIAAQGLDVSKFRWDVAPATVVKMTQNDIAPASAQALGLPVTEVTGYQSGANNFCAACHTDYNSNSAKAPTGTFSQAFRHKIVQGLKAGMVGEGTSMVCLTCHFAHGTDVSIMKDARDNAITTPDVNASSALKRYTNMSVCWKCHTDSKGEQLKNNDSYWNKVDAGTEPIH